jgi:hypothetical protein
MAISQLYPAQRPSLDLNFARAKQLDSRISFVRGSIGTYVGEDGLIKTAVAHEARFDHDPTTGESLGLLVEENRTNFLTYSEELDTNWSNSRLNIIQPGSPGYVSTVAPDGGSPTYWVPTAVSNRHQNVQTASVPNGTYTFSFYAKADPSGHYRIQINVENSSSTPDGRFNLDTGVFELNQGNVYSQFIGDGWYRIYATQQTIDGSFNVRIDVLVDGEGALAPGDGVKGLWVWGAQLEAGSFPTSYIPTTSSTVTRAADVASITGTNFSSWYNQSEGTFYSALSSLDNGVEKFLLSIDNSAGGEFIRLTKDSINRKSFRVYDSSNVLQVVAVSTSIPNSNLIAVTKYAAAYLSADSSLAVDGVLIVPSPNNSFVGVLSNRIYIGSRAGGQYLNGHISRLTYYPTRLSDTILQSLTS